MPEEKTLLLVRHAKSSWSDSELSDIDRPLNKRGRRNAPEMGCRLADREIMPDRIVSSPAVRALTTARLIASALDFIDDIVVDEDLYGAYSQDVLDLVSEFPDQCRTVMVVGHNPTMTDLACRFADEDIDNVPTCGILTIQATAWTDIEYGRLLDFDYPKR